MIFITYFSGFKMQTFIPGSNILTRHCSLIILLLIISIMQTIIILLV